MGTDLGGKTILVTGASSGIGLETCVTLAARGAEVVMVARDAAKGARALEEVRRRSGSSSSSLLLHDLSSLAAVRLLAEEFRAKHGRLDVLVNNAGGVSTTRRLTVDGLEQTFAVNHLAPFLLTNLLVDLLRKSAPSRIVTVASIGHYQGDLDFENLQYERGGYFIMRAYNRSKLANVLFTRELARRLAGTGVTANCLHPGAVATGIWTGAPWYARPILEVAKWFMLTPAQGGERIVFLAADPAVEGKSGGYYDKNAETKPSRASRDDSNARRLWEVSERLVATADSAMRAG